MLNNDIDDLNLYISQIEDNPKSGTYLGQFQQNGNGYCVFVPLYFDTSKYNFSATNIRLVGVANYSVSSTSIANNGLFINTNMPNTYINRQVEVSINISKK